MFVISNNSREEIIKAQKEICLMVELIISLREENTSLKHQLNHALFEVARLTRGNNAGEETQLGL
ncbi:hypothetical protein [Paenibacillus cremeus]|uniref:Uncharacterized protein n=1 Tax=Paenibacillus cremeus TaxID=2163881 RepID=A0A559K521_9BACL|nr:hypothetical protein [Paenibacillus cremeus]TVY07183.1 hypothetical protein FPZ49_25060 [Paenibacillus cremeus]